MSLGAKDLQAALAAIARWREAPETQLNCPRCSASGLSVIDRSARPYAEWYHMGCPACGLDETIHIPLGPPVMGGLD
jgi:transcription elongation factor Elf1